MVLAHAARGHAAAWGHTRPSVLNHRTNSNVAADAEQQADDYAKAHARFADFALALTAIAETRTRAILLRVPLRGCLVCVAIAARVLPRC